MILRKLLEWEEFYKIFSIKLVLKKDHLILSPIILSCSAMLLLLSGDVETNPGPAREKKPDPKKVMEEKVNTHDEKIIELENTVRDQKKKIKEMTEKQVELQTALEDQKVALTQCFEDKKVVDTTLNEIKQALTDGLIKKVENRHKLNYLVFFCSKLQLTDFHVKV